MSMKSSAEMERAQEVDERAAEGAAEDPAEPDDPVEPVRLVPP